MLCQMYKYIIIIKYVFTHNYHKNLKKALCKILLRFQKKKQFSYFVYRMFYEEIDKFLKYILEYQTEFL